MSLWGNGAVTVIAVAAAIWTAAATGCDSSKSRPAPAENTTAVPTPGNTAAELAAASATTTTRSPAPGKAPAGDDSGVSALVKSKIKTRVLELTDACRSVDKTPAISRFVYRGDDLARKWKSALRPDDPGALALVTDACKRITAGLSASVRPEFTNFSAEAESEGLWLVWEVRFEGNGTVVREAFAFLEVDGDYLLGDVD